MTAPTDRHDSATPVLRVVRGAPGDDDIAALVAVLLTAARAAPDDEAARRLPGAAWARAHSGYRIAHSWMCARAAVQPRVGG